MIGSCVYGCGSGPALRKTIGAHMAGKIVLFLNRSSIIQIEPNPAYLASDTQLQLCTPFYDSVSPAVHPSPQKDIMAHHVEHADDDSYHPKDAVSAAIRALAITGGIGFVGAAAQVTVHKQNMSPLAVVTRFGGTMTMLGMRYLECQL